MILVLQNTVAQTVHGGPYCNQVLSFRLQSVKRKSFGVCVITTQFKTPILKSKSIQNEINTANTKQNKNRSKS